MFLTQMGSVNILSVCWFVYVNNKKKNNKVVDHKKIKWTKKRNFFSEENQFKK